MLCGCGTTGRLALVDLDFRTPEQIQAEQLEAIAPFVTVQTNSVRPPEPKPVQEKTWWTSLVQWFGSVSKMRLRILPIEWRS